MFRLSDFIAQLKFLPDLECPFVRGRPVNRRYGNIVEPQVNSQLSAMVDHMINDKAAQHGGSWKGKELFAIGEERPQRP